jgi:ribonuclease P protein component
MRKERLTKIHEFAAVYEKGHSWANELLVMRILPNGTSTTRFGIVTSKRVGKAVVRNRVKRRLREGLRLTPIESGWDIVIIARPSACTADYHHLRRSAQDLLRRSRLLRGTPKEY